MEDAQVTPLSAILSLQVAVCALFQNEPYKDDLLKRFDVARDDLMTSALYSRMSDADLEQYQTLCKGMRALLTGTQSG